MTWSLRLLMVEDSATDAKLVVQELQRSGCVVEFDRVETAEAMRAALERTTWDAVTSDWSMPKFTAPAALAILKEKGLDDVLVVIGGIIPDVDIPKLKAIGVKGIFLPGTPMQEIIEFISANVRSRV